MFEKFTDRARRIVVLSQEEARRMHHGYIGTEHLLLALLHEGVSPAYQALESFGVTLEKGRETVEEMIGMGSNSVGFIPFTNRAKKVLELSLREALILESVGIHPVHILLGIIREGEGFACQCLVKMGVDPQRLKARVLELITDVQLLPRSEEETENRYRTFDDLSTYPATEHAYRVLRYALEIARQQSSPLEVRHIEMALRNA
jgi:ATP-dependent Clp protease ATP-binding subunit ClpA